MISLDDALSDHATRAAQYDPPIWTGHYDKTGKRIGEMSLPEVHGDEFGVVVSMLAPWAITETITDSVVVMDWHDELWAMRLSAEGGMRQTMWIIPKDGVPREDQWPHVQRSLYELADKLWEQRRKASPGVTYETAVLASAKVYEAWR